ncbi:hypothetical protein ONZ45_g1242 [Pleurotus djamor]|nr:hypothetical protein ONZ45_g1242 [Pleurotus djamor]
MAVDTNVLEAVIRNAIPVSHLEIEDQSNGCGENYAIILVSEAFEGKTTLARHRWVNELLKNEIAQMHAFSQKTFTPKQYEAFLAKTAISQTRLNLYSGPSAIFFPDMHTWLALFLSLSLQVFAVPQGTQPNPRPSSNPNNSRVLILGGGVTGIIAARTLHQRGLNNFLIIEGRDEIGGRLQSRTFGGNTTIELGANWVQGTQEGNGPSNPIWELAKKHHVRTVFNDYSSITTYDDTGAVDYVDVVNSATGALGNFAIGAGQRTHQNLIDLNARAGYALSGSKPQTPHARAAEYWNFDWEYGATPAESSWIASALNNNFTFDTSQGGFSDENRLAVDQRGFRTIITAEADGFLRPSQLLLNATVKNVHYSATGVKVDLVNGSTIDGDYALCTFSLGVLQNDDVVFKPSLPAWKEEAIQSMTMTTYTKIFLHFQKKFWFGTQFGLYADKERGRYPVWQSLDVDDFLPGSGILFATVTGDYSERTEGLPNAQVQSEVMGVLRSMFPNITISEPTDFFFPRWHSNPLFRGSYSNWPSSFTKEHQDNLRANVGERLWFAGEATSFKYYGV